ncbi:MAG: 5-guanidino-2-oxopentanoate decarboxylase [Paracoccaceae bacterium]
MQPLGAQISHMLKARGVEVIFGIPGVHNQELYRGIEEAGIRHVLARHEQGAGFMADGYARATGRPGVAYVITGPGLTNIMTPMGQAYSDSVPMLVISSCLSRSDLGPGHGRLHEMRDQEGAAATVCDWSKTALSADSAYHLIDRALLEFASERPGPKHIQVPIDVLEGAAEAAGAAPAHVSLPVATPQAVADVAEALNAARNPLFVFGGGAVGAAEAARGVVAACGAASFMTYAGRGVIAPEDPLNFGSYLGRPESEAVIARSDCVVAVGTELSEVDLWRENLGQTGTFVRVDIDPVSLADTQGPADIAVLSDAGPFLEALLPELEPGRATDWDGAKVRAAKARWKAETGAQRPGIVPLCDALKDTVPPRTMFVSDMTQFAYVAKEVFAMEHPGLWHHPYGFGTLGYALPAAIGAKIGRGAAPVIAIAGDYGFQYTLQELGTAVELGLSLPVILWDNGKLKEIEDSMVGAQIAPNAVIARNPDFCQLAEAYGARSAAPRSLSAFRAALAAALEAEGPTLIHVTPETSAG